MNPACREPDLERGLLPPPRDVRNGLAGFVCAGRDVARARTSSKQAFRCITRTQRIHGKWLAGFGLSGRQCSCPCQVRLARFAGLEERGCERLQIARCENRLQEKIVLTELEPYLCD